IRLREGQFNFSLTEQAPTLLADRDISDESLPYGINAQEILIDLARGLDEDRRDSAAALEASFDGEAPAEPPAEPPLPFSEDTAPLPPGAIPPAALAATAAAEAEAAAEAASDAEL